VSLRQKTISGLSWSFVETFFRLGITFIVGVVLARLLAPSDFGLIGMLALFLAISQSFVESGFKDALIRKKHCSDADYSTVFYYNMAVSLLAYGLLVVFSGAISRFFEEPLLQPMIKVLGLVIIVNALAVIQRTQLIRNINFKLQTRITVVSAILSGVIAVAMAYKGFGVWALVAQQLSMFSLMTLLLWLWNKWIPKWIFSKESFRELFGFGSKLLLSGLLNNAYKNIYYLVIGRVFAADILGFYTRADQFKRLPSEVLTGVISRVTYPVLSSIKEDPVRLKANYKKLIKATMLLTFAMMLGLAAVSEALVISLIGEQWRQSVTYLQLLCFVGMMYPLHALNLNMLNVQGRSDLFLKLEVIKKILAIPVIMLGVFYGIKVMIAGMILNGFIAYYLNSYWSGRLIQYPIKEQLKDVFPAFFVALINAVIVFVIGYLLPFAYPVVLAIQIIIGVIFVIGFGEILRMDAYLSVKEIIQSQLIKRK
jgi:teichuronic acid exporter